MEFSIIDRGGIRDISSLVLDKTGQLRVVPASIYRDTTAQERGLLCVQNGLYVLPTIELVDHLRELIAGRSAIEIGAGNGVLAAALGIPATDSRMQESPEIAAHYAALRQPTVKYGENVEKLDAHEAVRKYKPQVVVAAWVTHKFDPRRPAAEGNQYGVVEQKIISNCETYIMVGNTYVHRGKPIWQLPHEIEFPDFLFSRATNGSPDFIGVWRRRS